MVVTRASSAGVLVGRWLSLLALAECLGCGGVSLEAAGSQDGGAPSGAGQGGVTSLGKGKASSGFTGKGKGSPLAGSEIGGTASVGLGGASGAGGSGGGSSLPTSYPGTGFVVHEWGTNTVVVGSDGSLQRGLQHEEEDLPAFVYDRLKAGPLLGKEPSVTIKMETPITYFYSDQPLKVTARVDFPHGVLTQWYPGVSSFLPAIAAPNSIASDPVLASFADPALDPSFPFLTTMCEEKFGKLQGGLLDWGTFELLARDRAMPEVPAAPIDEFSWSYARAVDANALQTTTGEAEKFLFYRGLGEFELPVRVTAEGGALELENGYGEAIPSVFVLNVDGERGAFNEHPGGVAALGVLKDSAPSLAAAAPLDQYAESLGDRVTAALTSAGLYADEATAMVNTWKRQWFRTPGVRLLFLVPQSWTERSIPLTISPQPDETLRVMLIRVEVIMPEQEAADLSVAASFTSSPDVAAAYFSGLGRFEEPRLRRALEQAPSDAGSAYLTKIASKASIASVE